MIICETCRREMDLFGKIRKQKKGGDGNTNLCCPETESKSARNEFPWNCQSGTNIAETFYQVV